MQRSRLFTVGMLGTFCALEAGCRTAPKPPPIAPIPQTVSATSAPTDIRTYLAASNAGTSVYRRRNLRDHSDRPELQYIRRTLADRFIEGDTGWQLFQVVERRLAAAGGEDRIKQLTNPGGATSSFALRFRLDEPMPLVPADIEPGAPANSATRLEYLDLKREPRGHGDLTRTATIEGYEDVDCPAGHFERCLRVRIDLHLDIRWGPVIDWTMYLWLSPQVGEVKRVQQLSGWLLIFPFGSSFEYELLSYSPPAATQPVDQSPPLWKEGLVAFDHGLPSPSMGTLLVHFASSAPAD